MITNKLDKARSELVSRPLVAIDIIMEIFSEIKWPSMADHINELLTLFSQAILRNEKINEDLWIDNPIKGLFNRNLSQHTRQFIGVCLLRLLSSNEECFNYDDLGIKAFSLFDDVFSGSLYPLLKVDKGHQTYEKRRKLKDVVLLTENELSNAISSLNSLEMLSRPIFRQRFMQSVMNNKSKEVIWPFLPRGPLDIWLAEVFDAAENYLKETEFRIVQAFEKAQAILDAHLQETERFGTKYSREYLGGLFGRIGTLLQKHFENNPLSKPARLTISPREKKYPFSARGRSFHLDFIVENHGPGYASEVSLQFTEVTDLSLIEPDRYIGPLGRTSHAVEIPVEVEHATDLVMVEGELHWKNFDNTTGQDVFSFGLEAQRSDIDWDSLKNKEPYSLEPVKTEEELVGRSEILNQLAAQAYAESMGSSYICGQKRVGKTSIAKTLETRLTRPNSRACLVINLEVTSNLGSTAETTIQALGKKLCEDIQKADKRLANLEIPDFVDALSPLSNFLDSVLVVAPDCRILFILDEFDVLPFELYRRGSIGNAFFGPLRAISGKQSFGFILVGGERMDLILDHQGIMLNKFIPVRVDYFDKERHWHDFEELVRKPVAQWLEISDKALQRLFDQTAGNPFFTKLICKSLFELMVSSRDCYATPQEIEEATRMAINTVEGNSFKHFWEEGIFATGERFEELLLQRKKMMVVLAETLRQYPRASRENIIEQAKRHDLPEPVVVSELNDFVRRQVLVIDGDVYKFKVPFFSEWLKEKGIREIAPTFADPDMILKLTRQEGEAYVRSEEIVEWVRARNISYKGQTIGEERVRAWLRQFGSNRDQRLMFQVLQNLDFYNGSLIRSKLKEAHGIVRRGLTRRQETGKLKRDDILVSYLDNPGKSGARYAKLYAEENGIYRGDDGNVIERGKLGQAFKEKQGLQALVFVDDFIGTGQSASEYYQKLVEEYGDILRNRGLRMFFITLCGFETGRSRIENVLEQLSLDIDVRICDPLDDTARCFSDTSRIFRNAHDRELARQIAYEKGRLLEGHAPLGYGECEAAVVFEDSCPNNTLPILWADSRDWIPLFKR